MSCYTHCFSIATEPHTSGSNSHSTTACGLDFKSTSRVLVYHRTTRIISQSLHPLLPSMLGWACRHHTPLLRISSSQSSSAVDRVFESFFKAFTVYLPRINTSTSTFPYPGHSIGYTPCHHTCQVAFNQFPRNNITPFNIVIVVSRSWRSPLLSTHGRTTEFTISSSRHPTRMSLCISLSWFRLVSCTWRTGVLGIISRGLASKDFCIITLRSRQYQLSVVLEIRLRSLVPLWFLN